MEMTDHALLTRWAHERDAEAFRELVERHSGLVFGAARRILRNDAAAEDVAQECFMALARTKPSSCRLTPAWLHRVAVNRAIDALRSETRRKNRESQFMRDKEPQEPTWDDVEPLVDEAVAKLPELTQAVIVQHFFEGKTHSDIARNLGCTRSAVTHRIQRGVEIVRGKLAKQGVMASGGVFAALLKEHGLETAPTALTSRLGKMAIAGFPKATSVSGLGALLASGTLIAAGIVAVLLLAGVEAYVLFGRPGGPAQIASTASASGTLEIAGVDSPAFDSSLAEPAATPEEQARGEYQSPDGETAAGRKEDDEQPAAGGGVTISGIVLNDQSYALPGAHVLLVGRPGLQQLRAECDRSGRFRIGQLPSNAAFQVSVNAEGYRLSSTASDTFVTTPVSGELSNLKYILIPGTTIRGKVLNSNDIPLADALVTLRGFATARGHGSQGGFRRSALTDQEGRFLMGVMAPGVGAFLVTHASEGEAIFSGVVMSEDEKITLRMGQHAEIAGVIATSSGKPAEGYRVNLQGGFSMEAVMGDEVMAVKGDGADLSTVTDDRGHYVLASVDPNQTYIIGVKSPNGSAASNDIPLEPLQPGEHREWNYTIQSGMQVSGSITTANGTPVQRARIMCEFNGHTEATWVERGHFSIALHEPGQYLLWPNVSSYDEDELRSSYGRSIDFVPGETVQADFLVPSPFSMTVRAVDEGGHPITEAEANVWCMTGAKGFSHFLDGKTDSNGEYTYGQFAPGAQAFFTVQKKGYASTSTTRVSGQAEQSYGPLEVVLYRSGGLEGHLLDAEGKPLANARAGIGILQPPVPVPVAGTTPNQSFTTDAQGGFTIADGLPATDCTLYFYMGNGPERLACTLETDVVAEGIVNIGGVQLAPKE